MGDNSFLTDTSERADLNQYWYSRPTIAACVSEVEACGGKAALVSTPSIYFSLSEAVQQRSYVLDYDKQWASDRGYVFYDFNTPELVPSELHNQFDFVLVDPPFITCEVWAKYAITTKLLLRPGGRVLCTTIAENANMMKELLGLQPVRFRPSIPNLVYQYCVYTNYDSDLLNKLNPEIDDEDWMAEVREQRRQSAEVSRGFLGNSCQPNVPTDASLEKALAAEGSAGGYCPAMPAEADVALPPGAELLTELRGHLNTMKRCTEAMMAPVQTAIRRRQAGGEAAAAASAKATAALDAADAATSDLSAWLSSHAADVAAALGETLEAFCRSLEQDRFRTRAIASVVCKARGDGMKDMEEYGSFSSTGKQNSTAVFRLSTVVMDRIKVLKREAATAREV
jgi:hypothetical protein